MESAQSAAAENSPSAGKSPFASLAKLNNAIQSIDRYLASTTKGPLEVTTHRRLVFLRNTLTVSYELWQTDTHHRVNRSRQGFYIFCMTDGEKLGFQRRMVPALSFAADELRSLQITALTHIADIIGESAADAQSYVNNNKEEIRTGLGSEDTQAWRVFHALPLPEIKAERP